MIMSHTNEKHIRWPAASAWRKYKCIWKVSNRASINDCGERVKPYPGLEYMNI